LCSERLMNQITWAKPNPPPNALHTAFTHLKAADHARRSELTRWRTGKSRRRSGMTTLDSG
jgi:hypothetical protein